MGFRHDLAGQRFGKLNVVRFEGQNKHGSSLWRCLCDCGTEKAVSSNDLRTGNTTSCGCHRDQALAAGRAELVARQTTHGKSRTKEHRVWQNMIYRCHTKTSRQYADYGGRGIKVCARWRKSFSAFLEDMGPAPSPKHSLDRLDNDKGYGPGNCRWATPKEQQNNRRANRPLEYKGEKRNLCEWAERFGLDKATLHGRLRRGWSVARSLETPPRGRADTLIT